MANRQGSLTNGRLPQSCGMLFDIVLITGQGAECFCLQGLPFRQMKMR